MGVYSLHSAELPLLILIAVMVVDDQVGSLVAAGFTDVQTFVGVVLPQGVTIEFPTRDPMTERIQHKLVATIWNNRTIGVLAAWGPFYLLGLTLIPACISNCLPGKMWDEITYPFLNFNGCTVEV